jgi:hypothetical protein
MDDSKNEYANQLQKTNELQVCIHKIKASYTAASRMFVMQYIMTHALIYPNFHITNLIDNSNQAPYLISI